MQIQTGMQNATPAACLPSNRASKPWHAQLVACTEPSSASGDAGIRTCAGHSGLLQGQIRLCSSASVCVCSQHAQQAVGQLLRLRRPRDAIGPAQSALSRRRAVSLLLTALPPQALSSITSSSLQSIETTLQSAATIAAHSSALTERLYCKPWAGHW